MSEKRAERDLVALLFAAAIAGISGFLVPFSLQTGAEARAMVRWPTTQGQVEDARLHHYSGKGGSGYLPELDYSYSVRGQQYIGLRTSAGFGGPTPHWTREDDARRSLPQRGHSVTVRYNPEHPERSVIYVVDPLGADYLAAGFLVVIAAFAASVAFVAGRRLYRGYA